MAYEDAKASDVKGKILTKLTDLGVSLPVKVLASLAGRFLREEPSLRLHLQAERPSGDTFDALEQLLVGATEIQPRALDGQPLRILFGAVLQLVSPDHDTRGLDMEVFKFLAHLTLQPLFPLEPPVRLKLLKTPFKGGLVGQLLGAQPLEKLTERAVKAMLSSRSWPVILGAMTQRVPIELALQSLIEPEKVRVILQIPAVLSIVDRTRRDATTWRDLLAIFGLEEVRLCSEPTRCSCAT
jgi:hypothetical protein